MTQAFNLSQLANNLNTAGQLDATDGLVNAVPVINGGTGASTEAAARTNLNVPTRTGGDASGTWGINVTGNANTVTNGVYLTGDQTVAGTKTFTSGIRFNDATVQTTAAINAIVNVQTFNTSGTWTKPTGGQTMAEIQVWGGGGGGGNMPGGGYGGGGGGGGYNSVVVPISYLAASVSITVGTGGAARTVGGTSSVPLTTALSNGRTTLQAFGGGAADNSGKVGTGGSALSAGTTVIDPSTSPSGIPIGVFAGGNGGAGSAFGGQSIAGSAPYGGGGGGSAEPSFTTAGQSVYGGSGGAGNSSGNGSAGVAPGGGGGGALSGNTGGAGAAGRVVITCW